MNTRSKAKRLKGLDDDGEPAPAPATALVRRKGALPRVEVSVAETQTGFTHVQSTQH